ncbi:hypothetical protein J7T55_001862 [Diaporthe amygdali]|uniref:uncharacterized protein n=1 Tax=Phomopsis amygdali TaxID=1214568 RepID=UPI0022FF0010|nr:uncharacterized protein J7T55_001862 [Diaporthe amygdali]KAJ0117663.1 hypothetical protein J7T55_001862 [Diaporthe amygdali]
MPYHLGHNLLTYLHCIFGRIELTAADTPPASSLRPPDIPTSQPPNLNHTPTLDEKQRPSLARHLDLNVDLKLGLTCLDAATGESSGVIFSSVVPASLPSNYVGLFLDTTLLHLNPASSFSSSATTALAVTGTASLGRTDQTPSNSNL